MLSCERQRLIFPLVNPTRLGNILIFIPLDNID
jgi:hypothetical protein